MVRHLVSLFVATMAVIVAVEPAEALRGPLVDELVGATRILVLCAVVTVLAHGLVTWWRRRVSLFRSALFTWCVLTLAMALPYPFDGTSALTTNLLFASLLTVPATLLHTALRVFVPPFQVRVGGLRIRPVMSGDEALRQPATDGAGRSEPVPRP